MVRTVYTPTDEHVFSTLFKQGRLVGGGFNDNIKIFAPKSQYIRGSGWFSRTAIPLFKKFIAPNLIDFGTNFLSDINSGKSAKSSAKKRGVESLKKTVKKVLSGQGRRIKKKKKCCVLKLKNEKLQRKKLVERKEKSKFLERKIVTKEKEVLKNANAYLIQIFLYRSV